MKFLRSVVAGLAAIPASSIFERVMLLVTGSDFGSEGIALVIWTIPLSVIVTVVSFLSSGLRRRSRRARFLLAGVGGPLIGFGYYSALFFLSGGEVLAFNSPFYVWALASTASFSLLLLWPDNRVRTGESVAA